MAPLTNSLAQKIAKQFMLSSSLGSLSLEEIENPLNYLLLEKIHLGFSTKQQLKKLFNNGIVSKNQYLKKFVGAQTFYRESSICAEKDGLSKRISEECRLD